MKPVTLSEFFDKAELRIYPDTQIVTIIHADTGGKVWGLWIDGIDVQYDLGDDTDLFKLISRFNKIGWKFHTMCDNRTFRSVVLVKEEHGSTWNQESL